MSNYSSAHPMSYLDTKPYVCFKNLPLLVISECIIAREKIMKSARSQNAAEQLGPAASAVIKISRVLYSVSESVSDPSHSKDVFYFPCNQK